MAVAITNRLGTAHITPEQDAMWHRGILNTETCVVDDPAAEGFSTQIVNNNEVRIRSGVAMLQGRYWCVPVDTYDPITIQNGSQGESRIDLIVMRWTVDAETDTQNCAWAVIQGTPAAANPVAPAYTEGDLDSGDSVADMPMFQVLINDITLTSVTPVFDIGPVSNETRQLFADAGYPITEEGSA